MHVHRGIDNGPRNLIDLHIPPTTLRTARPPRFLFGSSPLNSQGLASRSLSSSAAGGQHAGGRARNIVQSDLMAELDRRRLGAVLAAGSDFQLRASRASP